jgi:hypothetical protein
VVDLLAEQSEEALKQMRESVQAELARLTVEIQQIDQALAKKSRRSRTGGGKLSRDQVVELVVRAGRPLTPAEVRDLVAEQGITASLNAVRNHLLRAEHDGILARFPEGRFGQRPNVFVPLTPEPEPDESDFPAAADDDIPF